MAWRTIKRIDSTTLWGLYTMRSVDSELPPQILPPSTPAISIHAISANDSAAFLSDVNPLNITSGP